MSVLDAILRHKCDEVAARREQRPLADLRSIARSSPPTRSFADALTGPGLGVIAEIKRRSPAKGDLRPDLDSAVLARHYAASGASALSILTDERFFGGSDYDLSSARTAVSVPVLRKDFTLDPYQLYEARALGADAVLLIVRCLPGALLQELLEAATELELGTLVEIHDEAELIRALDVGARLVGVNNRNLDTLVVDPSTSFRLRPGIRAGVAAVSESGISSPELAGRLAQAGYDAILVGEALLTAPEPGRLLQSLIAAGQPRRVEANATALP